MSTNSNRIHPAERENELLVAAVGLSEPKTVLEPPELLVFKTDEPELEPVVVEAGLKPETELEDGYMQDPELGLTLTVMAVPPKSQLVGTGFF